MARQAAKPLPELPAMPQELLLDPGLAIKLLAGFLKDELQKTGLKRAVLGLSGGIDSALVAGLAAKALGPGNVWGLLMPYKSSSAESLSHGRAVARAFGIHSQVVPITAQVDAYFRRFPRADALRRGNKMARERMSILYDHSAALGALVLGTSNKTELLLGYGTLHGDLASALNPLGDLYKTQVRQLSLALGVPRAVVAKAPSADLWAGQTDEADLGFAYEKADLLLYHMVDRRAEDQELKALGFEARLVALLRRKVRASQYKRRMPLIAKVSQRTPGRDFRYPRDWGL
jgi:NAD+ synthase